MQHTLYTLVAHADVAKFELEDAVVRNAASSLLSVASTIDRIVVDVHTERNAQTPFPLSRWDATVLLSATNPIDAEPEAFDKLVSDVAVVDSAWAVSKHSIAELQSPWAGTATPGVKLNLFLVRAPGVDRASFDSWLREAMMECVGQGQNMGARQVNEIAQQRGEAPLDSLTSFWFATEEELEVARAGSALDPLLEATLVDQDQTVVQTVVEHRLVPNPNQWPAGDEQ